MLLITMPFPTSAFEGALAKGTVYFNDQKATVDNATLKIGEPFNVKAIIIAKKDIDLGFELSVSGFGSQEKNPYEVIEGPSKLNEAKMQRNIPIGENVTLEWRLKATDAWLGFAPLNIDFSIYDSKTHKEHETVGFTIVNAYISNEYYQGVTPSPSPARATSGFEFLLGLSCVSALGIARARRIR